MSSFKIPFGQKNERLVEVSEVLSGLRCGCICPGCQKALIARKGDVNAHHFAHAHAKDSDLCEYGSETAIHLMAKQILCEEKVIFAPLTQIEKTGLDSRGYSHTVSRAVRNKGSLVFDEVVSEKPVGTIIPDILASIDGEPFIVEIAVTHFCEEEKIAVYRKARHNVLEIDLRAFSKKLPTKDELRTYLTEDDSHRTWLSLKTYEDVEKQVEGELQEKIVSANSRYKNTTVTRVQRPKSQLPQQYEKNHHTGRITYRKRDASKRWFTCPLCQEAQKTNPNLEDHLPEQVYLFSCNWEEAPWNATSVSCPFCNSPVIINQGACYPLPD